MKENYPIYLLYLFHWRAHSPRWDAQLPHKKMKTMFLSNMSKSRRLTSTFFPITFLGFITSFRHVIWVNSVKNIVGRHTNISPLLIASYPFCSSEQPCVVSQPLHQRSFSNLPPTSYLHQFPAPWFQHRCLGWRKQRLGPLPSNLDVPTAIGFEQLQVKLRHHPLS